MFCSLTESHKRTFSVSKDIQFDADAKEKKKVHNTSSGHLRNYTQPKTILHRHNLEEERHTGKNYNWICGGKSIKTYVVSLKRIEKYFLLFFFLQH